MRVKAQVAMVMNLDKCIGCHTCSVTCKQVWTNRPGTEYVWFNNVETEPGPGLPAPVGRPGALERRLGARPQGPAAAEGRRPRQEAADDLLQPRPAGDRRLLRAVHLRLRDARRRAARRPRPGRAPALAAHRQADGRHVGAQLGRGAGRRPGVGAQGPAPAGHAGAGAPDLRAGVHVLPAADLRALPEPVVRRLVPVGRDVQARGGRHRARRPGPLPRLALLRLGLPVQEGLLQPPHRQGREVHALLPADRDRPADDLLGDLRRAHPLPRPRALRRRPRPGGRLGARRARPARRPARRLPRPRGPRGARGGARATASRATGSTRRGARRSTTSRCAGASRCRCTRSSARCRWSGTCRRCRRSSRRWRSTATRPTPTTSSARSTTCGSRSSTSPTCSPPATSTSSAACCTGSRRCAPTCASARCSARSTRQLPGRVGLTGPELERMYRLLAIADYEDRYVIPQAHAELGERLMQEQGGCGLDFDGGPGNCGAVDPRPDTSSPVVPYDGESFHLLDILKRDERHGRMRRRRADRRRPRRGRCCRSCCATPTPDVAAARDELAAEVAALPDGPVRDGARALPRRLDGRPDGARRALRRDVRPAPPREPAPHLLRARRHARARDGAAAPEEALPRRRAADGVGRAARPPDGDARVRRARAAPGTARRCWPSTARRSSCCGCRCTTSAARTRTCSTRSRRVPAGAQRDRARRGRAAGARGPARGGGRPRALRAAGGDADRSARMSAGEILLWIILPYAAVDDVRRRHLVALPRRPVRLDERLDPAVRAARSSAGPARRSTTARSPPSAATSSG